mgnify:FL=1
MRIGYLHIKNFKSIKDLELTDIDDALILVGRNNSGKSNVLDAVRAVAGDYSVSAEDFHEDVGNIVIDVRLEINEDDLEYLHDNGIVSNYKHYDLWQKDFCEKLPSYCGGILEFQYVYRRDGAVRYRDGVKKNNPFIKMVMPKIYYVDHGRNKTDMLEDINLLYGNNAIAELDTSRCIFDSAKKCNQCFSCIGYINQKKPDELTLAETSRLMQHKLFNINLNALADKLNRNFVKNGAVAEKVRYEIDFDAARQLKINTIINNDARGLEADIQSYGEGLKSIYILSLLETYVETDNIAPYIIIIEEPELFLHPQLQKAAGEIMYRLSRKNQIMFCTHAPVMLFNFTTKQIHQVITDRTGSTILNPSTDIDKILDDLGYTANDLLNVSFVFIVEGKQDRNRLPLLLKKYYSEIVDENGHLNRVAIIATNSCTNIKTHANLKYINSLYLKDAFLMIRDSDGKNPQMLKDQLCGYYRAREHEDTGTIPRVTDRNVLILKYYSFENYFLDPKVMAKIGVIKNEQQFYDILYAKYTEYLYKLKSMRNMQERFEIKIDGPEDIKGNLEKIRIYVRGHNLYDIFYGRYKGDKEPDILTKYIEEAPRETFADILDAIDDFVYFNSHSADVKG